MISVLILTKNEAADLPGALASVAWSDDVHVLDAESTDGTRAIAEAAGARVWVRAFDDFARHRNFGLGLPFRYGWVLVLDADERPTPELVAEMQRVVGGMGADAPAGFRVRRRDFLFGTWLRRAQLSPFYLRLVQPEHCRYTRAVNEVLVVDGRVGELRGALDHYPFSKGIAHWVAKHNVYSTMEAKTIAQRAGLREASLWTALRGADFHTRRLHQKALFYRMPGRPLLKWAYLMLVRGAWRDGRAGWAYATLQAFYEYLIVLKTRELVRAAQRGDGDGGSGEVR